MTTNDIKSLATKAKWLNISLILLTLYAFISYHISNFLFDPWLFDDLNFFYQLGSLLLFLLSSYLFFKMKNTPLLGGTLMFISAIISVVFSFSGGMLGIVIFILSGKSNRQLTDSLQAFDFSSLPKVTPLDTKNDSFSGLGFDKDDTKS